MPLSVLVDSAQDRHYYIYMPFSVILDNAQDLVQVGAYEESIFDMHYREVPIKCMQNDGAPYKEHAWSQWPCKVRVGPNNPIKTCIVFTPLRFIPFHKKKSNK
jgi:hypothetical protein